MPDGRFTVIMLCNGRVWTITSLTGLFERFGDRSEIFYHPERGLSVAIQGPLHEVVPVVSRALGMQLARDFLVAQRRTREPEQLFGKRWFPENRRTTLHLL
jgi:hypothetical protein